MQQRLMSGYQYLVAYTTMLLKLVRCLAPVSSYCGIVGEAREEVYHEIRVQN